MNELDHAGNGRAGVEKSEAVVVVVAAVGEHVRPVFGKEAE
jgi:hypothetical protein